MDTYPNVEHDKKIKGSVEEKCANAEGLGEFEPWYLELGETEYVNKVEEDPFQEKPYGLAVVFYYPDPIVQLPGHEGSIEAEGVEALCRRIDDMEGYQRVCGICSLLCQGGLW